MGLLYWLKCLLHLSGVSDIIYRANFIGQRVSGWPNGLLCRSEGFPTGQSTYISQGTFFIGQGASYWPEGLLSTKGPPISAREHLMLYYLLSTHGHRGPQDGHLFLPGGLLDQLGASCIDVLYQL